LFILFLPFPSVPRTDDSGIHPYIPLAPARMLNSCVDHEILREARALDTRFEIRRVKDEVGQPKTRMASRIQPLEVSSSATATLNRKIGFTRTGTVAERRSRPRKRQSYPLAGGLTEDASRIKQTYPQARQGKKPGG